MALDVPALLEEKANLVYQMRQALDAGIDGAEANESYDRMEARVSEIEKDVERHARSSRASASRARSATRPTPSRSSATAPSTASPPTTCWRPTSTARPSSTAWPAPR
jgi:hypothetical protein